jgi:hypothetical protein
MMEINFPLIMRYCVWITCDCGISKYSLGAVTNVGECSCARRSYGLNKIKTFMGVVISIHESVPRDRSIPNGRESKKQEKEQKTQELGGAESSFCVAAKGSGPLLHCWHPS